MSGEFEVISFLNYECKVYMNQTLSLPQHIEYGWWLTVLISRNDRGFLLYNLIRHRFLQHAHQVEINRSLTEAIV